MEEKGKRMDGSRGEKEKTNSVGIASAVDAEFSLDIVRCVSNRSDDEGVSSFSLLLLSLRSTRNKSIERIMSSAVNSI